MSNSIHEILLDKFGLDTDLALNYKGMGSAAYSLNVLKGEDGVYGEITNLKGNRKVTYTPPANHPWLNCNVYFTLASCYDSLTRNVYFWVFSQPVDTTGSGDYEYDNRLLRFNEDSEVIDTIFVDYVNYFGLDPLKPFKDSFVLGDWLYFNPQSTEPKMIHIQMAYNYTNYYAYDSTLTYVYGDKVTYFGGLFLALVAVAVGETPVTAHAKWERLDDCYQNETNLQFDSEFRYAFNVVKYPPAYRPICTYGSDAERSYNNVKGIVFRFASRFKYFDNSYSKYSAYSDVTLPVALENYNGEVSAATVTNNFISVYIPLFSSALVKEVEVVFQSATEHWKLAKKITRKDISLLTESYFTYKFYNEEAYPPIDESVIQDVQDYVPRFANSQEIINKNILCYGGCTEGFNNLDKNLIDVSLTPELVDFLATDYTGATRYDIASNLASWNYEYYYDDTGEGFIVTMATIVIDLAPAFAAGVVAGDIFKIQIDGKRELYTVSALDDNSVENLVAGISAFIQYSFALESRAYTVPTDSRLVIFANYGILSISLDEAIFYAGSSEDAYLVKQRGFKTGAWHPFCIFYYDDTMRRWDAQTSKDNLDGTAAWEILGTTVYVPMFMEMSPVNTELSYKWNINWGVNHLPPTNPDGSRPKYWRWGYAGNTLCKYFVQYIIGNKSTPSIGHVTVGTTTEPLGTTFIDITPLQTLKNTDEATWNKFPDSIIDAYQYDKGDRIKFITEGSAGLDIGPVLDTVLDFEIIAWDSATNRLYVQYFDYSAYGIGENSLVEIYKPTKNNENIQFYEFGEIMPIVTDSLGELVHGAPITGNSQETATDTPATGTFTNGDVYHIKRTPSKPIDGTEGYFHESLWYSDFYESDDFDRGKIGYELPYGERYLNIVRYSNQYLANTLINGLSTFEGNNLKELNDVYGGILRIIEIGDTLKVYQRKKPSSILIGRTEYVDSSGQPNVVATSDRVLGSIRYSSTNYGTEFPESISKNNRYVYGFDIYNGVMWRDSANGIFPISGRYESQDGGGNYLMETWFKEKAKAMLVSGKDHCNVFTVWDERHKNLYVIFKDIVDADNDDAIMFHEPSNRWICFTDMGYTPAEGWNQILELEFEIVSGFQGGLIYEFDVDTRFTVFSVTTPTNTAIFISGTLIVDEDNVTYITDDIEGVNLIE
jgi:hypothetical protein